MNGCRFLSCILENNGIFLPVQDICGIGRKLFYIVAPDRQVGFDLAASVLVKRDNLNQSVSGDNRAVCRRQFLFRIQAKGYIINLAVLTDAVGFIRHKALDKVDFYTLPFVIERSGSFGNSDILTCIYKLNGVNFLVQHHSERRCDFLDLVFAEIEFLAYRRTVCTCGNGIDNLALRSSERTVQSINILGGGNLIDCALKSTHRIDRLIQAARFIDGAEHFARFGYGNRAFLCYIGAHHLNDGNSAFNLGVLLHHIKINRLGVQHIPIRRLHFYERIALAVFQGLRRDKLAIGGGIKGVNGRHFGIGEGHCHKISVRVVNLEACACIWNGVARFRIFLHDLDIAFKVCVVDKIAVGLTVLADKHIKGLHQLTTLPTRGLADGVDTVRHILCLGKAVFITSENISLGFLCGIKAACRLAEYFKGCACFGCFNLRFAVVGVLDNGDIALDDLLGQIICGRVKLHGVKLWLCADLVDCPIE